LIIEGVKKGLMGRHFLPLSFLYLYLEVIFSQEFLHVIVGRCEEGNNARALPLHLKKNLDVEFICP